MNVETADMKERQNGQHVVVGGEAVHVLAHHPIPQQGLLSQYCALWPSCRARCVDDQQRAGEVGPSRAAVTARSRQQGIERDAVWRREVEAYDRRLRKAFAQFRQNCSESLLQHQ